MVTSNKINKNKIISILEEKTGQSWHYLKGVSSIEKRVFASGEWRFIIDIRKDNGVSIRLHNSDKMDIALSSAGVIYDNSKLPKAVSKVVDSMDN